MNLMASPTAPTCGVCGATTGAYLCQPCTHTYAQDCLRVPAALAQLRITQARGDVRTTERTTRAGGPAPLPYNEAASTVIRDLARLLFRRGDDNQRLEHVARCRARDAHITRRHPDAPHVAAELARLLTRADRVIDRKATVWTFGVCSCGQELHGDPDATTVTCPGCNTQHDAVKLKERQWAAAAAALVTQAEAAQWLAIRYDVDPRRVDRLRGRINTWVSRQRITGRPGVVAGKEQLLVVFGDVDTQWRKTEAMNRAKAVRNRQTEAHPSAATARSA